MWTREVGRLISLLASAFIGYLVLKGVLSLVPGQWGLYGGYAVGAVVALLVLHAIFDLFLTNDDPR